MLFTIGFLLGFLGNYYNLTVPLKEFWWSTNPEVIFTYYDLALKKCHHDSNWTIHGLWPERNKSLWPQYCNQSYQFTMNPLETIKSDLEQFWFSCEGSSENVDFWKHEYLKHGTCTPFNESTYFGHGLTLYHEAIKRNWTGKFCQNQEQQCLISLDLNLTLKEIRNREIQC